MPHKETPLYDGKQVTFEEYQNLQDDGFQYEIIEGVMRMMAPAPFDRHQNIAGKIYYKIEYFLELNSIGIARFAPRDVKLSNKLTCQPDVLFISKDRLEISKEPYVDGAPDFIVEVLSKRTFNVDTKEKFLNYQKYGVKEYWIMNPDDIATSKFYHLVNGKYEEFYPENGVVKSKVIDGFELNLAQVG